MHYLRLGAFIVALFIALTQLDHLTCSAEVGGEDLANSSPANVELSLRDGCLLGIADGVEVSRWNLPDAKPYQIVSLGSLKIVTTCSVDLEITTIVASSTPVCYVNMLPILVEPPFAVISEIAVPDTTQNGKISLVNADGAVVWHNPDGMLLQPNAGELPDHMYMFATTPDSTPTLPMGANSELVLLNAQTATEEWRIALPLARPPVDAQLLAAGDGQALLLLQYGYVSFEFVVLDLDNGEFLKSWSLSGQVASQVVFPGGFSRLAPIELDNNTASLVVNNLEKAAQIWSFDLELLSLEYAPAILAEFNVDMNDLPPGGSAIPDPGNQLFPQNILPTESDSEWTIPAVVDSQGRVLIVTGDEAGWVSLDNRPYAES